MESPGKAGNDCRGPAFALLPIVEQSQELVVYPDGTAANLRSAGERYTLNWPTIVCSCSAMRARFWLAT